MNTTRYPIWLAEMLADFESKMPDILDADTDSLEWPDETCPDRQAFMRDFIRHETGLDIHYWKGEVSFDGETFHVANSEQAVHELAHWLEAERGFGDRSVKDFGLNRTDGSLPEKWKALIENKQIETEQAVRQQWEPIALQRLMAFAAKRCGEDPSPAQMALAMTN